MSELTPARPVDTDRNLLIGVLAHQADLIDNQQFVDACAAWAARKDTPLAELLVERGWLTAEDKGHVEYLLERTLKKHSGARAGLGAVADDAVRRSLATLADGAIQQSLAALPEEQGHVLLGTMDWTPERRERYTLTRLHSKGGVGQIWLARDAELGREVALKELRPEHAKNPTVWSRFLQEARITGQLEHPNIVPIYELADRPRDQQPFYTMRFVKGRTLSEAVRAFHDKQLGGDAGALEQRALLGAFVAVCNAVAYAHARGVIHRDLKGQNVVLGDFGEAIVLDWGLAKLAKQSSPEPDLPPVVVERTEPGGTIQGQVLGTPAYMAPEQAAGRTDLVDRRTDVYGLGAILYEILTGQAPFSGADSHEVLRKVQEEAPARPRQVNAAAPPALEAVCLKAMAKRPQERYSTALELARDMQRWLADEPVTAYREPWATRVMRWGRKHRMLVTSAAALLVTAVVALSVGTVLIRREQVRTEQARAQAQTNFEAAEVQHSRAERNFQKAREAVDQMLTRVGEKKLRHVPQMEQLRRELLEDAVKFNQGFLREQAQDPDVKHEMGQAHERLAYVYALLGRHAEAEKDYRQAINLFEELAAKFPNRPEERRELAGGYNDLSIELAATGKLQDAQVLSQRAATVQQQLIDDFPDELEYQEHLANSYVNWAKQLETMGKRADAEKAIRLALGMRQKLVALRRDDPSYRRVLALTYNNLANLEHALGRRDSAAASFAESQKLCQELVDEFPADAEYRSLLARSYQNQAILFKDIGRAQAAVDGYRKAIAVQQKLASDFPAILDHRHALAAANFGLAAAFVDVGQLKEAEKAESEALTLWQRLVAEAPQVPEYRFDLASSKNSLANLLKDTARPADAEKQLNEAVALLLRLSEDYPTVPDYRFELGRTKDNLANFLDDLGRRMEAERIWNESIATLDGLSTRHPEKPEYRFVLANAANNLGTMLQALGRLREAHVRAGPRRAEGPGAPISCCPRLPFSPGQ